MGLYFGIAACVISLFLGIKNMQNGIASYIVFSLICPVAKFSGLELSYELYGIVILFFALTIHDGWKIKFHLRWSLILYFVVLVISSYFSATEYNVSVNLITCFGVLRLLILLSFLRAYAKASTIKKAVYVVLFINALMMAFQYFSPSAVDFSYLMFSKESSSSLEYSYNIGALTRLSGTFSNILPVGYFMLFAFVIALSEYWKKTSSKWDFISMPLSVACGVMTASKTAFLGFPLIIIIWAITSFIFRNKDNQLTQWKKISLVFILVCVTIVAATLFDALKTNSTITYYYSSIISGDYFESRYGTEGVAQQALGVFKDNWLFGVGNTRIRGEFIGDTQFVGILHDTGVVGLGCIASVLFKDFFQAVKAHDIARITLTIILVAVGFAGTTVFSTLGIIVLSYVEMIPCQTCDAHPIFIQDEIQQRLRPKKGKLNNGKRSVLNYCNRTQ